MHSTEDAGFRHGDLVEVPWPYGVTTPARVIVERTSRWRFSHHGEPSAVDCVVVATHFPYMVRSTGVRILPTGTPTYATFAFGDVALVWRDSGWDPFGREPALDPTALRVIKQHRSWRIPSRSGLTHVGAYIPSTWYPEGAPAWVWEGGWRRAFIVEGTGGWIRVRFGDGHRRPRGARAYRPYEVSPAICSESAVSPRVNRGDIPVPHHESHG